MAGSTTTTHTDYRPILWAKDTLDYLKKNLVLAETIDRTYDDQVQEYGQSINILPFSTSGAARDMVEGTDVTFDSATETKLTLNIDKWKYKAHQIFKLLEVQSKYKLRAKYTKDAAYVLKNAVDVDVITAVAAAVTAGGAGYQIAAGGTGLTDAKLRQAIQILGESEIQDFENVTIAVNPDGFNDLIAEQRFTSSDYVMGDNGRPLVSGRILQLYGIKVVVSTNVPAGFAFVYHQEAATLAIQNNVEVTGWDNVRSGAWEQRSDIIYGTRALRTNVAVRIAFV